MASVRKSLCAALICAAGGAAAQGDQTDALIRAANSGFDRLPRVEAVPDLEGLCGGGAVAGGVYCTSEVRIYLTDGLEGAERLYTLAHLYGHALQVEYGLADIALARIRADRTQEAAVRSRVTRQVECFAGMLLARAGVEMPPLDELFATEPMTGAHWGRNPVARGPMVRIGLAARAEWFAIGYGAAEPEVCSVGDLPADLVVAADAGR